MRVAALRRCAESTASWFQFVTIQGDLATNALACINAHQDFLQEVEVTQLTKSFKLILLESLLENDGFKLTSKYFSDSAK